jgi:hypothetical protein
MTHNLLHQANRGRPAFRPAVEALETRLTPSLSFGVEQLWATDKAPYAVAVADFSGDGRPDLVTADKTSGTVSVLLNTTAPGATTTNFAVAQTFAVGNGPTSVAVGDFNGDGRPDIAVANYDDNTVSVLMNTTPSGATTPSFAPRQTFAVGSGPASVAEADFNGDGRPDLAVTKIDGSVSVLLNQTPPGVAFAYFAPQQTFAAGLQPRSIAVGDFNGDGRPDLAVANYFSNSVSILPNTTPAGAATVSFAPQQTFAAGNFPASVVVGDFNGDGRPDLAVANAANVVSVLVNRTPAGAATPSFFAAQTFAAGGATALAVSDFDGDGRPDLVVTNNLANTESVLVNTTSPGAFSPSFAAPQSLLIGNNPVGVAVADFTGDGRPDLVVADSALLGAVVIVNTSSPLDNAVPVVVGQFGTTGVWEFNRTTLTWVQLNPSNASRLAADPQGDVAAEFPGIGVWEYKPLTGWKLLNGVDATALAMDPNGDVTVEFPGYGVGEYLPASGWRILTPSNATLLAMDANGDVAGEFPGYGIQLYRPAASWQQINGVDASALAMNAQGEVVANFPGYGVGAYLPASGWKLLNGVQAQAVAVDAQGDVAAQFAGYGVGEYLPAAGWQSATPANAGLLAADALGALYGGFAGYGVWEFDPALGWHQIRTQDTSALAVA